MDRNVFFDHVRSRPFGGSLSRGQVDGMNAILDGWAATKYSDLRWLGDALATTYWETWHTMQPIAEVGKGRGHAYGNPTGPWHQAYYGRGLVQETWINNYSYASERLKAYGINVDLVHYPDRMLDPTIATPVLLHGMAEGWFTGKKLGDYFNAHKADPYNARRIINGLDHASEISGIYAEFMAALSAATVPKIK